LTPLLSRPSATSPSSSPPSSPSSKLAVTAGPVTLRSADGLEGSELDGIRVVELGTRGAVELDAVAGAVVDGRTGRDGSVWPDEGSFVVVAGGVLARALDS